jgi:uncharacterized membrane protein YphA (DoxX/SURF4 family)
MIRDASHAKLTTEGKPSIALWPAAAATGRWPLVLAWAVALTELGGGLLVLVGMLTRLSALGLAGVMLGAMWLTQIGPAIQSGSARLAVLPGHDLTDVHLWTQLLWQFALFMMSMALLCAGPGVAAIDRVLFKPADAPAAGGPRGGA